MSQQYFDEDNNSKSGDAVFQVMELLNVAVVPRPDEAFISSQREKSLPLENQESRLVCELFQKLENDIVHNKEKEVLILQENLQNEKSLREDAEGNNLKLKKYLVLLQHNIQKLIANIYSMIASRRSKSANLILGPFRNESVRDRFVKEFRELATHFCNGKVDDFYETIVSLKLLNKLTEGSTTNGNRKQTHIGSISRNENPPTFPAHETVELPASMAEPESCGVSAAMPVCRSSSDNNSNNNSLLFQLLESSPSSPSDLNSDIVEIQHLFDNSKRDANFFYCTCGAQFPREKYLDLTNHIKFYRNARQQHEAIRGGVGILKCTECGEYFYSSSFLMQHILTVHGGGSVSEGENLHNTPTDEFSQFLASTHPDILP